MAGLLSLALLFVFLAAGLLLGKRLIKNGRVLRISGLLLSFSLYALLFSMGFRLGRNSIVRTELASIGLMSLFFAVSTVAATLIILLVVYSTFLGKQKKSAFSGSAHSFSLLRSIWEPVKLAMYVVAGFITGFFITLPTSITGESITSWLLYFLLFLVGLDLSKSRLDLKKTFSHHETFALPLGTLFGTLLGGALLSMPLNMSLGKALAVSAGFGWYSLSGIILADLGDPVLGSVGFLANIFRESLALLVIPLLAKSPFPRIGIGAAGATSMDVSLPLIERSCGPLSVPVAISHGALLSLLVPFLVPLFYHLG